MKIVYITGCLGFMASYVVRKALARGWMVRGIDKITYAANPKLLDEFTQFPNFIFEKVDIRNLKHLYDSDYVINFAAESHVGNSIINSDEFINSNIIAVRDLLDLIRFKPVNCSERPVCFHVSTDEVYGDVKEGAHTERDLLRPSNPYSAAKAAGDMLIHAWARTYDIKYVILRPTNNYGIGQYPEKLIPLAVKNLLRKKNIHLHNDGTPIRNWLHAEDTADAVMTIIDSGKTNQIYNVAGGFEQTNKETVRKVITAFNGTEDGWENHMDFSAVRPGQDVRYALNDSKLRALGWSPKKNFDEEIPKIVEYYKNNFIW
jgi:dTDP-glucose 4,6-dehydratase